MILEQSIKEKCNEQPVNLRGRKTYITKKEGIAISFLMDGDNYLGYIQYALPQKNFEGEYYYSGLWSLIETKDFYDKYLNDNDLEFKIYSQRVYGDAKLKKPTELKNMKTDFSVDYIPKKCRCSCFIKGNDVWIQHKDYFSETLDVKEEDIGKPLEVLSKKYLNKDRGTKFTYSDSYGTIILRNEAWIVLENLIHQIKLNDRSIPELANEILRKQEINHKLKPLELEGSYMMFFWEGLLEKTKQELKKTI